MTPPVRKPIRMAPEERRRQLVEQAADFFADEGFDGGTRELAQRIGVTQPLIYRYFPSKEDLINEVYRTVYLAQWQEEWAETLCDRSREMRVRLLAFYASYCPVVFNRRWMRIFFHAGLRELDINTRYIERVETMLLHPICHEMREILGHGGDPRPLSREELELVWLMHGMVFYQGIREQIYRTVEAVDYSFTVQTAVEMYLRSAPDVLARALPPEGAERRPAPPGAG